MQRQGLRSAGLWGDNREESLRFCPKRLARVMVIAQNDWFKTQSPRYCVGLCLRECAAVCLYICVSILTSPLLFLYLKFFLLLWLRIVTTQIFLSKYRFANILHFSKVLSKKKKNRH